MGPGPPCSERNTTQVAPLGPLSKPLFLTLVARTKASPGHTDSRGGWTEAHVLRKETRQEVRTALIHKRGRGSAQRGTCYPASRVI